MVSLINLYYSKKFMLEARSDRIGSASLAVSISSLSFMSLNCNSSIRRFRIAGSLTVPTRQPRKDESFWARFFVLENAGVKRRSSEQSEQIGGSYRTERTGARSEKRSPCKRSASLIPSHFRRMTSSEAFSS